MDRRLLWAPAAAPDRAALPGGWRSLERMVESSSSSPHLAAGNEAAMDAAASVTATAKPARTRSKRMRAAEVHNMSEKRRRSRINEKMKALQSIIPNSNKTDKASMLDEAIEYLKQLQLQVQILSMRNRIFLQPTYIPMALEPFQDQEYSAGLVGSNGALMNSTSRQRLGLSNITNVPGHMGLFHLEPLHSSQFPVSVEETTFKMNFESEMAENNQFNEQGILRGEFMRQEAFEVENAEQFDACLASGCSEQLVTKIADQNLFSLISQSGNAAAGNGVVSKPM